MAFLASLFRRTDPRHALQPLYDAVVARGRQPHWYRDGQVPDTLDGRFDMIAAILSLVLLRMETLGAADDSVRLTELFVDDMEGQLRQIGIGDLVVGKQIGRMMSALGGRLGAYREALVPGGDLAPALERNLYRGDPPAPEAVDHVADRLRAFAHQLEASTLDTLRAAKLPPA